MQRCLSQRPKSARSTSFSRPWLNASVLHNASATPDGNKLFYELPTAFQTQGIVATVQHSQTFERKTLSGGLRAHSDDAAPPAPRDLRGATPDAGAATYREMSLDDGTNHEVRRRPRPRRLRGVARAAGPGPARRISRNPRDRAEG